MMQITSSEGKVKRKGFKARYFGTRRYIKQEKSQLKAAIRNSKLLAASVVKNPRGAAVVAEEQFPMAAALTSLGLSLGALYGVKKFPQIRSALRNRRVYRKSMKTARTSHSTASQIYGSAAPLTFTDMKKMGWSDRWLRRVSREMVPSKGGGPIGMYDWKNGRKTYRVYAPNHLGVV